MTPILVLAGQLLQGECSDEFLWGIVEEDLNKAAEKWAKRGLFKPQRHRGRWLWRFVLVMLLAAGLLRYKEQFLGFV